MASMNTQTRTTRAKAQAKEKAKAAKAKTAKAKNAKAKNAKAKTAKAKTAKARTAKARTAKARTVNRTKTNPGKTTSVNKPARATGGGVRFTELRALIGLPIDDGKVAAVLARAGAKWQRPDGGQSYAVAKKAGFDLLAERPEDAKRGAPMLVHTIFMYREAHDGHRQFADPPPGLAFTSRAGLLVRMPRPARSWLIGTGEVPADSPEVDHDAWTIDGVTISADYDSDQNVCTITASMPQDR
jgi:hypothetical protein